jgi:hypothetical protein
MAIAKWIVAFVAVYGFGGMLADFVVPATAKMHMKNPHWPPHAKFHNGQTMLMGIFAGTLSLCCLFAPQTLTLPWFFAGVAAASLYWTSLAFAQIFPGTDWSDPEFDAEVSHLKERLRRLRTMPGVGPITALTWALEIGDVTRFTSIKQAISYCGLCGDERSSADKVMRMPISKQRNKHIQRVLIEAAKLGPRFCYELAEVRAKELEKGDRNRATLAVARKMVCYLLAVDKRNHDFVPAEKFTRRPAA